VLYRLCLRQVLLSNPKPFYLCDLRLCTKVAKGAVMDCRQKEDAMRYRWALLLTTALILGSNCTTFADDSFSRNIIPLQSGPESSAVDSTTAEQPDLSGEWLSEEDLGSTKMRLDKNGNGTYQWQHGHVVTTSISARRWQGIWIQEEMIARESLK
jgi:hypothetical protein